MAIVEFSVAGPLRKVYATIQRFVVGFGNLVPEQIIGLVPVQPLTDNFCFEACDCMPVFASQTGDIERENDKNGFLFEMPTQAAHDTFRLQKYNPATGQFEEVAILDSNAYGTFYNTGSLQPYTDYSGYLLEWQKVLQLHGQGYYRFVVIVREPNPPGPDVEVPYLFSSCFDLRVWSCEAADGTFYIETIFKGNDNNFLYQPDTTLIDTFDLASLATGWYDRCRYFGKIGNETYAKERINVVPSDNSNRLVFATDSIEKTLQFEANVSDILRRVHIYGMNSRTILVTDSNNKNTYNYQKQQVIWNVTDAPEYFGGAILAYNMSIKVRNYLDLRFHTAGFQT